uniref:Uncharacterized protein n=1 Tax=Anguilla anguilla TaxID=7936 RepID=A0A0E9WPU5_ANGAN
MDAHRNDNRTMSELTTRIFALKNEKEACCNFPATSFRSFHNFSSWQICYWLEQKATILCNSEENE